MPTIKTTLPFLELPLDISDPGTFPVNPRPSVGGGASGPISDDLVGDRAGDGEREGGGGGDGGDGRTLVLKGFPSFLQKELKLSKGVK